MAVRGIPIYDVWVAQQQPFYSNYAELQITVRLNNFDELNQYLSEGTDIVSPGHTVTLLVCCIEENVVLHKARICDDLLLKKKEGLLTEIRFYRSRPKITVFVHLISSLWVGVDVTTRIIPKFEGPYVAVEDETTVCEETEDEMLMLEYPVKSEPQSDDEDQNKVIAVPEPPEDIYYEEERLPTKSVVPSLKKGLFKSICLKDIYMEEEVIVVSSSDSSSAEDLYDFTTAKTSQTQVAIKNEIKSSPDSPNPGEKRKARPDTEDSAAATAGYCSYHWADTAQEPVDEKDTPLAEPTKQNVLLLYRGYLERAKKMKLEDNAEKISNLIALFGRDEVKAAGAESLAKKRSTPEEIQKRQNYFKMFGVEMEYDSDDELLEGINMLVEL